jgi:hypothetical protein
MVLRSGAVRRVCGWCPLALLSARKSRCRVVDGLRELQQASELENVQRRLKAGRVSLGSLSEASRVFDAELLKPILEKLGFGSCIKPEFHGLDAPFTFGQNRLRSRGRLGPLSKQVIISQILSSNPVDPVARAQSRLGSG